MRRLVLMWIGAVAAAAIGWSAGCSHDYGDSTPDAAPSADVDQPDAPAPSADAGDAEAEVPDANVPLDAPYDALYPTAWDRDVSARDAALGAASDYCNGLDSEWFCWDFEGADAIQVDPPGGWSLLSDDGGSLVAVGDAGTPLRAMQADLTYDGGGGYVALEHSFNSPPSGTNELILSFSFRVPRAETTARIMTIDAFGASYGLGVYGRGSCFGAPCFGEVGPQSPTLAAATPFDEGQWYRAEIDALRNAAGVWAATITVGGHVIAQRPSSAFPVTAGTITGLGLTVGLFDAAPPLGTSEVLVDDILLQVR